jgi:N6-L-threonylcarbamoyladenine synthase
VLILGIDTSCDDTAAAVLRAPREVLSNEVSSQYDLHRAFGGIVPEIASRAHAERVTVVIEGALEAAGVTRADLDAIAVTNRPGLIGSLMVGVAAAKALSLALDVPLIGVDHIEAHLVAAMAEHEDLEWPYVALVASGGHTSLYACRTPSTMACLGSTIDDAAGECFDKVAVLLGLEQPGGPAISKLAQEGNPKAVAFPRYRAKDGSLDFSFSGLKTAVLYFLKGPGGKRDAPDRADLGVSRADVAASFERAVVDVLAARSLEAARREGAKDLVIGGGVAANRELRRVLAERAPDGLNLRFPSPSLCVDNGAMVAIRGAQLLAMGKHDALDLDVVATGRR